MKCPTKYNKAVNGWQLIIINLEREDVEEISVWLHENKIKHMWHPNVPGLLLLADQDDVVALRLRFE